MQPTDPFDDEADSLLPAAEHDVLVRLRLSNRSLGLAAERQQIEELGDLLAAAVTTAEVGEYDGEELGGGECTLFFTGPDAERLFAVLQPLLHRHPLGRHAEVVLQFGGGDPVVRRV